MALRASAGVALLGASLALLTPAARASDGEAVALGEVSSSVQRGDVDLRALLQTKLVEVLRTLDLSHVSRKRRAILSVSLLRMDTTSSQDNAQVTTCIVSATLRDARRGAVFAILEGRARGPSDANARAMVRTAVRGAFARIPEAMGQGSAI
jgi:hypothetical protein